MLIVRKVGQNVIEIFSKIIGLLIAAMAIEYILNGVFNWMQIHQAMLLPNLVHALRLERSTRQKIYYCQDAKHQRGNTCLTTSPMFAILMRSWSAAA